jgi:hypothetical protein
MKSQELETSGQELTTQRVFPTFMEMVLDTVERVLSDNSNGN